MIDKGVFNYKMLFIQSEKRPSNTTSPYIFENKELKLVSHWDIQTCINNAYLVLKYRVETLALDVHILLRNDGKESERIVILTSLKK